MLWPAIRGCSEHNKRIAGTDGNQLLGLEAARQGIVLLQNEQGAKDAVVAPVSSMKPDHWPRQARDKRKGKPIQTVYFAGTLPLKRGLGQVALLGPCLEVRAGGYSKGGELNLSWRIHRTD